MYLVVVVELFELKGIFLEGVFYIYKNLERMVFL